VNSLSVFFPCYNDKGTIGTMIFEAKRVAEKLTSDFEIIVIDDGSIDGSRELLLDLQSKNKIPQLKLVLHKKNRGYGGALRSGFEAATKELVFYTDGDAQYDIRELPLLWEGLADDIDIVNGYKIRRVDPIHRIIIGFVYQHVMRWVFWMPIKDPDCDFRLIRRKVFEHIELTSNTGTITIELVKKIQSAGFRFAEVGVSHYFRTYGNSQFFNFKRVAATLWRLLFLWIDLMILSIIKRPAMSIVLRKIVEINFKEQKSIIQNHFVSSSSDMILDLGCGTGEFSPYFPKNKYIGVDIDPKNIQYAIKKYKKSFSVADGKCLPFADNFFTKVLVVGVFHHLSDDDSRGVAKEIKRVLQSDGEALIMEDTKNSAWLTRIMQRLDQGNYIRTGEEWKTFWGKHFTIKKMWTLKSGVSFYSAFLLINEKK